MPGSLFPQLHVPTPDHGLWACTSSSDFENLSPIVSALSLLPSTCSQHDAVGRASGCRPHFKRPGWVVTFDLSIFKEKLFGLTLLPSAQSKGPSISLVCLTTRVAHGEGLAQLVIIPSCLLCINYSQRLREDRGQKAGFGGSELCSLAI